MPAIIQPNYADDFDSEYIVLFGADDGISSIVFLLFFFLGMMAITLVLSIIDTRHVNRARIEAEEQAAAVFRESSEALELHDYVTPASSPPRVSVYYWHYRFGIGSDGDEQEFPTDNYEEYNNGSNNRFIEVGDSTNTCQASYAGDDDDTRNQTWITTKRVRASRSRHFHTPHNGSLQDSL